MKKLLFVLSCFTGLLYACTNADKKTNESENDVDAARNFIQAALKWDLQQARTFMLTDSANEERMKVIERIRLSPEEKKGLADASIIIKELKRTSDTSTIVIYANSFKNNEDTLRVLKKGEQWLVDLNYLFTHDSDSIWQQAPVIINDSVVK